MLTCLSFCECKTDLLKVTYTVLKKILIYVETDKPTWCYSSKNPKDTLANLFFHDKGTQIVVNVDYQFVKKKLALMITKTLFIRCYSSKCGLSWEILQHYIMHYFIALTNNSLSKSNFKGQTNIVVHI